MRHTETARQELNQAKAEIAFTDPGDPMNRHHLHVARALHELTFAIADIYDRLLVIERKQGGPSNTVTAGSAFSR